MKRGVIQVSCTAESTVEATSAVFHIYVTGSNFMMGHAVKEKCQEVKNMVEGLLQAGLENDDIQIKWPSAGLSIYPNPFRNETKIEFYLTGSSKIQMHVVDLKGRILRQLQNSVLLGGEYEIRWDGTNKSGQVLPAGMYLIRLTTDKEVIVKKVTLQRF